MANLITKITSDVLLLLFGGFAVFTKSSTLRVILIFLLSIIIGALSMILVTYIVNKSSTDSDAKMSHILKEFFL